MGKIVSVDINGRRYGVRHLNPMEAYRFYRDVASRKDSGDMARTGIAAIMRCVTPSGLPLDSDQAVNEHFSGYPADMLPLAGAAVMELVGGLDAEIGRYNAEIRELFRPLRKKRTGITVPAGWELYSFFGRLVNAGLCSYEALLSDELAIADIFAMHRILDWKDYCAAVALEKAETAGQKNMKWRT